MLKIHFLNVGHGDCCLIEFDSNRIAMIDINRSSTLDNESKDEILKQNTGFDYFKRKSIIDSTSNSMELYKESAGYNIELTDPIEYLEENNISDIFRFISTHPHMDHLSGLETLKNKHILNNIWITKNDFSKDESDLSDSQKEDWDFYKECRDNINSYVDETKILSIKEGAAGDYYTDDGIYILSPNDKLLSISKEKDNKNLMSTVLLIKYGECKIVLAGDAEQENWDSIINNYYDEIDNISILGAAHHGRDSGYHQEVVKLMNPKYTIVSVGKKPDTDSSNKYRQYSENVYSTRWKGNIVFECYKSGEIFSDCQYNR